MTSGSGNTGDVKRTDPTPPPPTAEEGKGKVGDDGINWAKATLDDLRMAFIVGYGPDKGGKMFNQFQMMICQTCLSQMRELEPKKQDDQTQNQ